MDLHGEKNVEMKLDNDLCVVFEELGRKYYSENVNKEMIESDYQDLFEKISDIYIQKDKVEARFLAKQGKRKCEKCNATVALESVFCNMCGQKLAELSSDFFKVEEMPIEEKKCSKCGIVLERDAVYCSNCGQKLT